MKKRKIVSLLLTLVMLLTLIPTMGVTAQAANYNPSPSWILIGNHDGIKKTDEEWYALMRTFLEFQSPTYIRLATDISVDCKGDKDTIKKLKDISVRGNNVLDLAGHKLDITLWKSDYVINYDVFSIEENAELNVVDSVEKGKIWGHSKPAKNLYDSSTDKVNIFRVKDGGKLIINAADATIGTGTAEMREFFGLLEGYNSKYYKRDVQHQTNGNVVTALENSTVIINGGKLEARGFDRFNARGTTISNCAVVESYPNSHVVINNGELRAMDGANCLKIRSANPDVTIRSAKLYRHKADVRIEDLQSVNNYNGGYSYEANFTKAKYYNFIGYDQNKLKQDLLEEGAEYIEKDEQNVIIQPKSETVYISQKILNMKWNGHSSGEYLDYWNGKESKMIAIDYKMYYPESDHHWIGTLDEYARSDALGDDYSRRNMWYNELTFTLTNGSGKKIGEYNTSLEEKNANGGYYLNKMFPDIASKLSMGETCTLRATMEEGWASELRVEPRKVFSQLFFTVVSDPANYGMKSVQLGYEGSSNNIVTTQNIQYSRGLNVGSTLYTVSNDKKNVILFKWHEMPAAMRSQGLSYTARADVNNGSNIAINSKDKCEYVYNIPSQPGTYTVRVHLNLEKKGKSIGILSNEHVVRVKVVAAEAAQPTQPAEPSKPVHTHKYKVKSNDVYHWSECECGSKMNIEKHRLTDWKMIDHTYFRMCTIKECGYQESYEDFSGTYKPVTNIVMNLKNYPMDGMAPHNFVHKSTDEYIADEGYNPKLGLVLYKMTERDAGIKYPKVSIVTGDDKVKLAVNNPDAYEEPAKDPDFLRWFKGSNLLMTASSNSDYDKTFVTGARYGAYVTLEAKDGYAFNSDFDNMENFKLYTDMENITIDKYRVQSWYYDRGDKDPDDGKLIGESWYSKPPEKTSKGASKVIIVFGMVAKNEGDLNITIPELKEGSDLKDSWAKIEGKANIGTSDFVKSSYRSNYMMKWTDGPDKNILSGSVSGNSVKAEADKEYTLTIPATNENTLPHIKIKNPEAASKVEIKDDKSVVITYEVSSDQPLTDGASATFTDVTEKHWFNDSVQYVYEKGLMNGITEKTFEPNKPTSRAMIVTILYRLEGSPAVTGKHGFKDVKQGNWYDDPVARAAENGIVTGYSDTEFGPSNNITREQMAAIMHRYANYKKYDTSKAGDLSAFSDKASLSSYATGSMSWAVGSGIISGKGGGNLVPRAGATRAEAAAILQRFCENTVK